jgi:ariadne-1
LLCCNSLDSEKKHSLECNHYFCDLCFSQYISAIFDGDGNSSIFKKCPMDGCHERLGEAEFKKFLTAEKFHLY